MRATVGLIAVIEGGFFLAARDYSPLRNWSLGLIAFVSGASLLIGILTPFASAIVGLGSTGIAFSWIPTPVPNLFDAKLTAVLAAVMAVAIIFLGPGAFSLDSRWFGRREIFIPPISRAPKS